MDTLLKTTLLCALTLITSQMAKALPCPLPNPDAAAAFSLIEDNKPGQLENFLKTHVVGKTAYNQNCETMYFAAIRTRNTTALKYLESIHFAPKSANEYQVVFQPLGKSYAEYIFQYGTIDSIFNILDLIHSDIFKYQGRKNQMSILMYAAQNYNHQDTIKSLIRAGVDINQRDINGKTALFYAIEAGSFSSFKTLIQAGAAVNLVSNQGTTVLHFAAVSSDDRFIKFLLNLESIKPMVNAANKNGVTPLHCAAIAGNILAIDSLIKLGANLEATTNHIYSDELLSKKHRTTGLPYDDLIFSPLTIAIAGNQLETAQHLIDLGANVYQPNITNPVNIAVALRYQSHAMPLSQDGMPSPRFRSAQFFDQAPLFLDLLIKADIKKELFSKAGYPGRSDLFRIVLEYFMYDRRIQYEIVKKLVEQNAKIGSQNGIQNLDAPSALILLSQDCQSDPQNAYKIAELIVKKHSVDATEEYINNGSGIVCYSAAGEVIDTTHNNGNRSPDPYEVAQRCGCSKEFVNLITPTH